ncbi:hypothetical protein N7455_007776 [Penicillium solitum]|uniref:uncharacterized protein n=1 Tax=Penicillium solitum TaxID=60172 RepID=UPI0032C3E466|nr:hypothetical protein N7455_007776 [Penicillium solitum]
MASEQPAEESIAEKEVAPTKERPTRRKHHRSQTAHFARKLRRAGIEVPEPPKRDVTKAKVSRQAKRRFNKRMRRAAAAAATATTDAAAAASPPTPNDKSRIMARSPQSNKDGNKPLDFQQPLTFRPKNSGAVAESPSETLSLTLRPKEDRA